MKRKTLIPNVLFFLPIIFLVVFIGSLKMSEAGQAKINIIPDKGVPGTKLTIMGTGFIPREKVKVIFHAGVVQLQFGTSGTGGICDVKQDGTFQLKPRGGVPIAPSIIKPGIYKVDSIGDKGSFASTQLEVLKKE